MPEHICCPQCGNEELQITTETNTQTTGKNYSGGQGCLGYLIFGPLGLLCGMCGQGQKTTTTNTTYWICPKCGKKFRNPDELREVAENAEKASKILAVTAVISVILTIVSCAAEYIIPTILLFTIAVFSIVYGFIGWRNTKNFKEELDEIESGMNRFQK